MSVASTKARLSALLGHLRHSPQTEETDASGNLIHRFNQHSLSPTYFLPRAAAIEPNVSFKVSVDCIEPRTNVDGLLDLT